MKTTTTAAIPVAGGRATIRHMKSMPNHDPRTHLTTPAHTSRPPHTPHPPRATRARITTHPRITRSAPPTQ
eukprot:334231-Chlamydomonas_euryale.AAC.1